MRTSLRRWSLTGCRVRRVQSRLSRARKNGVVVGLAQRPPASRYAVSQASSDHTWGSCAPSPRPRGTALRSQPRPSAGPRAGAERARPPAPADVFSQAPLHATDIVVWVSTGLSFSRGTTSRPRLAPLAAGALSRASSSVGLAGFARCGERTTPNPVSCEEAHHGQHRTHSRR